MTPTDELPPFETRLLAELTEVVEDRHRTATEPRGPMTHTVRPLRTRVAVATAGVAAAAIAIALAPGLVGRAGSPAYAVRELDGGVIEVRFDHHFRDGRALEAELRSHGVDVAIVTVPASPSAVGTVHGTEGPLRDQEPGFTWGPDGSGTAFTIDPTVFRGSVALHLAVDPAPGEPYQLREEVFEPGEVLGGLHCALGGPVRAEQVVPFLDDLGLGAVWETIRPHPDGDPSMAISEPSEDVPDGEVMWGYAVDADTVRFEVRPYGVTFDPAHYAPRLSDLPCTPDQAAAWGRG